jgi:hypothetical protein
MLVIVTLTDWPVWPTFRFALVAVMVKLPTLTAMLAAVVAVPGEPAPVVVTPYVPIEVELRPHDAIVEAFGEREIWPGHVTVSPEAGLTADDIATVPEKLLTLVTVSGTEEVPTVKLDEDGAVICGTPTWTVMKAE